MSEKNERELFKLVSPYKPTGDQPEAIAKLVKGIKRGDKEQTLLGVTGSGKKMCIRDRITLSGGSASSDSDAVQISGSTVTITDEGTYILSGTLNDGMIVVSAEDTDKIQLVLDNVEITSSDSAAIYVLEADKVFITTASGSENSLANGGEYVAIDDNNIDAVIFSKSDLTLNGAGTLTINAAAGHGVVSKDDLVLTSGAYTITAASQGLSGKDSVRIANGTYTITSGKDGIHAENLSLIHICLQQDTEYLYCTLFKSAGEGLSVKQGCVYTLWITLN